MAIDFVSSSLQFINNIDIPASLLSISFYLRIPSGNGGCEISFSNGFSNYIRVVNGVIYYGNNVGEFYTTDAVIIESTLHLVTVTFASDVDYKIYVDRVSKNLSTDTPPANLLFNIRDIIISGTNQYYIEDFRLYNTILTQSEIDELYNSRCQRSVMDGLVFWPEMSGASGLSSFDGATLQTTNRIIDRISGAVDIHGNTNIGRGNTIQRIY